MNTLRQSGMSLTEMLISLAISMVVIGGVVSIYTSTIGSSSATLKASKLNQELTAVLSVMVNDIRRAGFTRVPNYTAPQNNAFSTLDSTALEIHLDNAQVASKDDVGNCVVYAYDRLGTSNGGADGSIDNGDIMGFRLNNGVIQMRQQGNTAVNGGSGGDHDNCNNANDSWADVTDGTLINISALNVDLADSQCVNTKEPNGVDNDGNGAVDNEEEYDCYATAAVAGDVLVYTRQVAIAIEGNLVNDASVEAQVEQAVRVRNDLVRIVP